MRRLCVIEYKDNEYYVIQAEKRSEVMVRNDLFTSGAVRCGCVKAVKAGNLAGSIAAPSKRH